MNTRRILLVVLGVVSAGAIGSYIWPRYAAVSNIINARTRRASDSVNPATKTEAKANGGTKNPAAADEGGSVAVERYSAQIREILLQDKFDDLEAIVSELRATKARFVGGAWKLHKFYYGLDSPAQGQKAADDDWLALLKKLREWIRLRPQSTTARVALGQALTQYAWYARGSGFSDTVGQDGWRLFRERLALAQRVLEEAARLRTKCPHWYAAMQWVAIGQGWDAGRFDKLFKKAVAAEPTYHYFYFNKAQFLLPRWHGSEGDWENFAEETYDTAGGKNGSILYYLIGLELARYYRGKAFFSESRVSWPRMKQGFADLEEAYGANNEQLNEMSRFAGWAGDRAGSRELFERIGDNWDSHTWGEKKYFDEFKAWASCVQ